MNLVSSLCRRFISSLFLLYTLPAEQEKYSSSHTPSQHLKYLAPKLLLIITLLLKPPVSQKSAYFFLLVLLFSLPMFGAWAVKNIIGHRNFVQRSIKYLSTFSCVRLCDLFPSSYSIPPARWIFFVRGVLRETGGDQVIYGKRKYFPTMPVEPPGTN